MRSTIRKITTVPPSRLLPLAAAMLLVLAPPGHAQDGEPAGPSAGPPSGPQAEPAPASPQPGQEPGQVPGEQAESPLREGDRRIEVDRTYLLKPEGLQFAGPQGEPAEPEWDPVEIERWLNAYYQHPDPERAIQAYHDLGMFGELDLRDNTWLIFSASFWGRQFRDHPEHAWQWASALSATEWEHQKYLWYAIWITFTDQSWNIRGEYRTAIPAHLRDPYDALFRLRPPNLDGGDPSKGGGAMMLWGQFAATGDDRYLRQIARVLPWRHFDPESSNKIRLMQRVGVEMRTIMEQRLQMVPGLDDALRRITKGETLPVQGEIRDLLGAVVGPADEPADPNESDF